MTTGTVQVAERRIPVPWRRAALIGLPLSLALYIVVAFALFREGWAHPSTQIIGVDQDTWQHIWFISWVPFALSHGQNPFFSDYLNHPAGVNLLWNTSIPLLGLVLWPVTAAWGPVVAYNLMVTLAPALSAWAALLLFRRFVSSSPAAWLGGLLYGFSPYIVAQSLGHPAVTGVYLPPLILLVLDRIIRGSARWRLPLAFALALLAAAQLLISEEVLAGTAMVAGLLLAIAAALYSAEARQRLGQVAPALLLSGVVFAALVAYPMGFQIFGPQRMRAGPPHALGTYVTDLLNFWVPTQMQLLAPLGAVRLSDRFTGNYSEWNAYLGLPLTALLMFAAIRDWASGAVRLAALGASLIAILSMGLTIHVAGIVSTHLPVFVLALLYLPLQRYLPARVMVLLAVLGWLLLYQPPLNAVLPARLMLFVYLLIGGMLALFLDRVIAAGDVRWSALAAAASVLALVPLLPASPYPLSRPALPSFFTGPVVDAVPQGSVALVLPMSGYTVAEPMLWQASSDMRFKMPDGYVYVPSGLLAGPFVSPSSVTAAAVEAAEVRGAPPTEDPGQLHAIRRELAAAGVSTVIVGPQPHATAETDLFTRVLGKPPRRVGGVALWQGLQSAQT